MEFNLEVPQDHFFIRSVNEMGIRVDNNYYTVPFIISPGRIVPEWNARSVDEFNEENLKVIFDLEPEVILFGTGDTQLFLPAKTQIHFFRRNVGFEVMKTDAACRTFNVLASEGRQVVAALLPLTS